MQGNLPDGIWMELCDIVTLFLQGYVLSYFCGSFVQGRMAQGKQNAFCCSILYCVLREAENLFLAAPDYENPNYESIRLVCRLFLAFAIIFFLVKYFYRAGRILTVFLSVTYLALSDTGFLFAYTFWQRISKLFLSWNLVYMERGYITAEETIRITYVIGNGMVVLLRAVSVAVLFFLCKKVIRNFRDKDYRIHKTELFLLIMPSMAALLLSLVLRIIMIAVENEMPVILYDKYPILTVIVPMILLLSILSVLYGIRWFQDTADWNRDKRSRAILEKQIKGMQEHMEEVEHMYADVRSLRHDMKNTVAIISQLASIDNKENTQLQEYLAALDRNIDKQEFLYKTGNPVADTILTMKNNEISRMMPGISIDADRLFFPEPFYIQSYDIGVILGNALDNAIEACQRLRAEDVETEAFIRVYSFLKGSMFFLETANSFDGKIIRKTGMELPATRKEDKEAHGIGLANIRETAGKYRGAIDWIIDGKTFILSVMMANEGGESYVH